MSLSRERAFVLFDQRRYTLAERELRSSLTQQPDDPVGHALLAVCLNEQQKLDEAEAEARLAIAHGPALGVTHYAHASVLYERNRYPEAEAAVLEAIRHEPSEAMHFALLAAIRYDRRQWQAALDAADQGLALDPDHAGCLNVRSMALGQLGRRREADAALQGALAKDPENARTHATRGWGLLHQGQPDRALEHFREAVRINPELDWAREGVVEALKARHVVYRTLLRYFTWMSTLSDRAQWAVIIGGYLIYQGVRSVARDNPALQPFLVPVIVAYLVFALLTWIGPAVFDTALRLNRFGRLALSAEQRLQSNLMSATLIVAVGAGVLWLATGSETAGIAALCALLFTMPLAATFRCQLGWPRRVMAIYTTILAVLAAAAIGLGQGFLVYVLGAILSQWVGNWLVKQVPGR
jgi:tetratricopeptide (TPR) repeat protein